jgi:hypothetical protein
LEKEKKEALSSAFITSSSRGREIKQNPFFTFGKRIKHKTTIVA